MHTCMSCYAQAMGPLKDAMRAEAPHRSKCYGHSMAASNDAATASTAASTGAAHAALWPTWGRSQGLSVKCMCSNDFQF